MLLNHGFIGSLSKSEMVRLGQVLTVFSRYAVHRNPDGVWVGEAKIVEADLPCSNGVIHVIDKVLLTSDVAKSVPQRPDFQPPGGIQLAVLLGGEYSQGSPLQEQDRSSDEGPQRLVQLDPFLISIREVTREQYWAIMFLDPSDQNMPGRRQTPNDDPVQRVTWFEAVQFCNQLSELDAVAPYYVLTRSGVGQNGKPDYHVEIPDRSASGYRLPTEAEWEYACRAGQTGAYCFGNDPELLGDYAWFAVNAIDKKTQSVGLKLKNAFGLLDMHGNVAEWCQDWYADSYPREPRSVNPTGPDDGERRVIRGGSYIYNAPVLRSAARSQPRPPWYMHRSIGFRVARFLPPELRQNRDGFAELNQ